MRKLMLVLAAMACLGLTGCANKSKFIQPVDSAAMNTSISQDESAIVFFRATTFGGAIQAPVLEVDEDGSLDLVAIVSAGAKFLHRTTPGKHLYLIDGEFGYFMEADVEGGKTYYANVTPKMGWWKARFIFTPVPDQTDATFKKDLAWCEWYVNTPEGRHWFLSEKPSLEKRYADLITRYASFPPEDKVKMPPEYGSQVPAQ